MNKFKFLPFIAAAAVISGCQEYDLGLTVDEIRYKESFTNAFGQIDPNQNWDLYGQLAGGAKGGMTRASVNTSIGEFTIVDNLAPVELTDEQVLQYTKMMPEQTLAGKTYEQTNLGRVTQNFTANVNELTLYPIYWCTNGTDEIGLYYYADENTQNAVQINLDPTKNDGPWIVRVPITSNKKNIKQITWPGRGIQEISQWSEYWTLINEYWDKLVELNADRYIVSDGTQYNIYNNKTTAGEKLVYAETTYGSYQNGKYFHQDAFTWDTGVEPIVALDIETVTQGEYVRVGDGSQNDHSKYLGKYNEGTKTIAPNDFTGDNVATILTDDVLSIQSTGTKVTFPKTTQIGMYIKQGSNYMYSEYELNKKVTFSGETTGRDVSYVATYQLNDEDGNPILDEDGKKIQYLCFEDWFENSNFDLNDCVFRVFGLDESTIVDNDNYTENALLVCEDLGDFDFDFNDVVLKLTYINGVEKTYHYTDGVVTSIDAVSTESIKVTPMAAGGANESTVTIHPVNGGEDVPLGEIHELLGGAAPSIINAGPTFGNAGNTVEYPVTTYGASWDKSVYPTYLSMLFDKGFIKITSSGKDANAITSSGSYTETGTAPQMMLLPMSFEWPQERNPISEVYTGFSSWVSDITATDWINSNNGKVTKR